MLSLHRLRRSALSLSAGAAIACSGGSDAGTTPPVDPNGDASAMDGGSQDGEADGGATSNRPPSGTADATFGNGGVVELAFPANFEVNAIALQADGKILLAGGGNPPNSSAFNPVVMRFNANGSVDEAFGEKGRAMIDYGVATTAPAYAVFVAPDTGKIVMAGMKSSATTAGTLIDYFIVQLDPNGSVDTTFGTSGRKGVDPNGSHKNELTFARFAADGTLAFVGISTGTDLYQNQAITKVLPNGTVDSTFGVKGSAFMPIDKRFVHDLAFQPDGRMVICVGDRQEGADVDIERFDPKGQKEASVTYPIVAPGGSRSTCSGLTVQSDGKIAVSGAGFTCAQPQTCPGKNVLVRVNADLSIDAAFDRDGSSATLSAEGTNVGMREQAGGVLFGQWFLGDHIRTRRVNTDGALDGASFNKTGYRDLVLKPGTFRRSGFAIQRPDDKLVTFATVKGAQEVILTLERYWL